MSGPRPVKTVILDYDDTLTVGAVGVRRALPKFIEGLAKVTREPMNRVKRLFLSAIRRQDRLVDVDPMRGVEVEGRRVAHADAGAFLRLLPPTRHVLGRLGFKTNARGQEGVFFLVVRYAYPFAKPHWRRGCPELLRALHAAAHAEEPISSWIVTQSDTDPVTEKVHTLGSDEWVQWFGERVYGGARKLDIDPEWEELPRWLPIPDGPRVHLRRPAYFSGLESRLQADGTDWSELWALGDNFEMELAIPLHMGARVILILKSTTPEHEIAFLRKHERAHVVRGLSAVHRLLGLPPFSAR